MEVDRNSFDMEEGILEVGMGKEKECISNFFVMDHTVYYSAYHFSSLPASNRWVKVHVCARIPYLVILRKTWEAFWLFNLLLEQSMQFVYCMALFRKSKVLLVEKVLCVYVLQFVPHFSASWFFGLDAGPKLRCLECNFSSSSFFFFPGFWRNVWNWQQIYHRAIHRGGREHNFFQDFLL